VVANAKLLREHSRDMFNIYNIYKFLNVQHYKSTILILTTLGETLLHLTLSYSVIKIIKSNQVSLRIIVQVLPDSYGLNEEA